MISDSKRKLFYIGSSERNLIDMPSKIKETFTLGIILALEGKHHPNAKPFKGFGGNGVLEIVESDRNGTYRAVYTVKFEKAVYVLHVFQKKSKKGIATPKKMYGSSMNVLKELPLTTKKTLKSKIMKKKNLEEIEITESSGNVYADLGFKNPEEMMAKAKLAILIGDIIKERKLTQKKAAEIMGIDQPKVSAILKGHLTGFTIDRLFRFLIAFGIDIVIETSLHKPKTSMPHIQVLHHGIVQEKRATA